MSRNGKHPSAVLVEAAKLAPRYSHELALIYEKEMQRGNRNRATLAVARKMVAPMVSLSNAETGFPLAESRGARPQPGKLPMNEKHQHYFDSSCLPALVSEQRLSVKLERQRAREWLHASGSFLLEPLVSQQLPTALRLPKEPTLL